MNDSDIAKELLLLVTDLRAENAALQEIILTQAGLLDKEIIVPESIQSVGKEPWYIKKRKLQMLYRKKKEDETQVDEVKNAS